MVRFPCLIYTHTHTDDTLTCNTVSCLLFFSLSSFLLTLLQPCVCQFIFHQFLHWFLLSLPPFPCLNVYYFFISLFFLNIIVCLSVCSPAQLHQSAEITRSFENKVTYLERYLKHPTVHKTALFI